MRLQQLFYIIISSFIVFCLFSGGEVFASAHNVISQTNETSFQEWGISSTSTIPHIVNLAQSFKPLDSFAIGSVDVKLTRWNNSFNDDVFITIRGDSNNSPSDTVLAKSNFVSGDNIPVIATSSVVSFYFNQPYIVLPLERYWFVMERTNYVDYSTANFYGNRYSATEDFYKDGVQALYLFGGQWHLTSPGNDLWFVINSANDKAKFFWSEITNSTSGWLYVRQTPGTQNKPESDKIKTVPNGWVVKVASTTDENGNNVDLDGYRWYKVFDASDGAIGWMAGVSLVDGTVYLDNNQANQDSLEKKANELLDTKEKRTPVVIESVDNYFSKDDSDNSLYGGGRGLDGLNNFQRFIQGSNFPKELVLAVAAQESGISHNNEICSSAKDGGVGIMQMTSNGLKGLGSGLKNYAHLSDCNAKADWVGTSSKYYSNTSQGIYANIKDGFRTLQNKYRQKCPKASTTIDNLDFTCQDIEKVLTVWGYNGFGKDKNGNYLWHYLRDVSNKLENLGLYFPGASYANEDYFIEKLKIADKHRVFIRLYSPGELQIFDSLGRATGLFGGIVKEEIPNSLYEGESEAAAIFFPNSDYVYQVLGTGQGTYGLSIDSDGNEATSSFRAVDIPITAGAIHQYSVNWDVLAVDGHGVTIKVDQNSDGIFDYQFTSGALLDDKTAPTTTIQLAGKQCQNNSYAPVAQVLLFPQDNQGGVGVMKTEYSLDGGISWTKYLQPFNIAEKGTSTLLYRSYDFLGNIESTKTQLINVVETCAQPMKLFSIKQMNIFWGLDCQDLRNKLDNVSALFNLQDNQLNFSKDCLKNKNHFVIFGNFELPDEYQRQDLDKSAILKIKIGDISSSDQIFFNDLKKIWSYNDGRKNDNLNNGMDIKTAAVNWSRKQVRFVIQGELDSRGIDFDVISPEVTVTLEIPLIPNQSADSILGIENIKFKKLPHSWFYIFLYPWKNWLNW